MLAALRCGQRTRKDTDVKHQRYLTRAMQSSDRRYARILTKLGYKLTGSDVATDDAADKPQLDHDGDGKAGGSIAPEHTDALKALRDEYREVFGKRAFPGWSADELREKIAAANG